MLSLPPDLDKRCFEVFSRCDEFENGRTLRAVFTTTELAPFANGLPERAGSKKAFVNEVKLFLLEKHLADGRALILPLLEALCGHCLEVDALYTELHDLHRRVLVYAQPTLQSMPQTMQVVADSPAQSVDFPALRSRLQRLDAVGIQSLCLDYFPVVYDRFASGLQREEMINLLLGHCRRNPEDAVRLAKLLPPGHP